jgi:hypothetical protein
LRLPLLVCRCGRSAVEGASWNVPGPPEAAEAEDQRFAGKLARCLRELFDGVRRITLEGKGDASTTSRVAFGCFGGVEQRCDVGSRISRG